ncbi:Programmed cell death antitoxin MazE [hydrothermal vent metagenome]|uniref:Programmed cell death antitoxin MazE n=1 Tax=hydrothermal vent metagenome TaxID=652676 RepID=A0A3B1DGF9_9ZZZZ
MHVQIQKWGNSLAFRIPKVYAQDAHVQQGSTVDLSLVDGKIILAPIARESYTLKNLLDKVDKNNIHGECDFGKNVGKEVW